mgnify:CR=1 FL=1
MKNRIELNFGSIPPDTNIVDFLAARTRLSKTEIKNAMTKGAVWLRRQGQQRRVRRVRTELRSDDQIAFFYDSRILTKQPEKPTLLDDQRDFSVWTKPAGLLSSGSRFGDHCAIDRVVSKELGRKTFFVHRLDQFAWGLMVLAHDKNSTAAIAAQFRERTVTKTYQAIVHGQMSGPIRAETPIEGKSALSIIKPIKVGEAYSLVSISISTGRKHQIRIHLADAGFPIVGDRRYGLMESADLQLASVELAFRDPKSNSNRSYSLAESQRPTLNL